MRTLPWILTTLLLAGAPAAFAQSTSPSQQPGGITSLTGDCTASGPGAAAATCTKTGGVAFGGYATISAGVLTNSIASNVTMTTASTFYDGPSVAQGTSGTWFASGTVLLVGTTNDVFVCKLWDGTTVIASVGALQSGAAGIAASLSGDFISPAANIRISCTDVTTSSTPVIKASLGQGSNTSTITAFRIN